MPHALSPITPAAAIPAAAAGQADMAMSMLLLLLGLLQP
jgi:hypothetical protein